MIRLPRAHPLALALLFASLVLGAPRAAEDCSDLARIPDCPPVPLACTPLTCPPQDCSTCTPGVDDDQDCVIDEELLNGLDDDQDGLVDEDISCLNTCDPLNYSCPSALFPVDALTAPHPVPATFTLPGRVRQYACGAASADLDFTLLLEPDPNEPIQFCGGYRAILTVADGATGAALLRGPALFVLTRQWESLDGTLLDPPAPGNVGVTRYVVRADLAPFVAPASLPAELHPPCLDSPPGFFHVYFYGHLDVARDMADPSRRAHALLLHHAPSELSHPPTFGLGFCETDTLSGRPLNPGDPGTHDGGWFMVAPRDGFTFAGDAAVPTGEFRHGRIRSLPSGANEPCERETRICVSQFDAPTPPVPGSACGGAEVFRHVRFCGNQPDSTCSEFALSSDTRCGTIPFDLVAVFPVGRWSGTAFPGGLDVSSFEGAISCVPPAATPWRPYWYGSFTRNTRPGLWSGPIDALDVVDNQAINMQGTGLWLIGACNWIFEGTAGAIFRPVQYRAMHFFPDQNPDIPTLAPCAAQAIISPPAPASCVGAPPPPRCEDDVSSLELSAECSLLVNCCQCGGLEVQWSVLDAGIWTVLEPWDTDLFLDVDPPPAVTTDYRLEVRCSNSRTACVSEVVFTQQVNPQPAALARAFPDQTCAGGIIQLDSGACAGCTCVWTASAAPDPLPQCAPTIRPAGTTTYTVVVTDPATGCSSPPSQVVVTVQDLVALAGADRESCDCTLPVRIVGSATGGPCASGLEYRWRRFTPTVEYACGDDTTWLPAMGVPPTFPCDVAECSDTWELEVRCADVPGCVATDRVTVTNISVTAALSALRGCVDGGAVLDASGSTAAGCNGGLEYQYRAPSGAVAVPWTAADAALAMEAGTWTVEVRCAGPPACTDVATVDVVLDPVPTLGLPTATGDPCTAGIELSWPAPTFPSGSGSVHVYRSTLSCLDAGRGAPLVLGVMGTTWTDFTAPPGTPVYYVIEAEDGVATVGCRPMGPANSGSVARQCLGPFIDSVGLPQPALACWPLRVRHVGDQVTADWTACRALLATEHFHLHAGPGRMPDAYPVVNGEGSLARTFTETNPAATLQYFDLRIANSCEDESEDDEPPGLDPPANGCP